MGEGKIDESWRISPYRQQERAVSVKEYVQSPSILERWTTKEEERIKRSTPLLAKLLLIVALVCLIPFIVVGLWIALYLAAK